jgi:hypothetical protein
MLDLQVCSDQFPVDVAEHSTLRMKSKEQASRPGKGLYVSYELSTPISLEFRDQLALASGLSQ